MNLPKTTKQTDSIKTKLRIRPSHIIKTGPYSLVLGEKTCIMGIINVTPDSFSNDGCLTNTKTSAAKALKLATNQIENGVDLLDIGGESSRPGSQKITAKEEIKRIIPLLKTLRKKVQIPISVDTYKPLVARQALDAGANMINNINGADCDLRLLKMVRDYDAAIVLMHMRGTPKTMQKDIHYSHLMKEIYQSLQQSIDQCLDAGIKFDKIIIDPGIGFGKSFNQNLEIINQLDTFHRLNRPILVGTSRKTFIGEILKKGVDHRLSGTLAAISASIMRGCHIVRVHDVKEAKQTALMTDAIINQKI